jgi:hypothetical protein
MMRSELMAWLFREGSWIQDRYNPRAGRVEPVLPGAQISWPMGERWLRQITGITRPQGG